MAKVLAHLIAVTGARTSHVPSLDNPHNSCEPVSPRERAAIGHDGWLVRWCHHYRASIRQRSPKGLHDGDRASPVCQFLSAGSVTYCLKSLQFVARTRPSELPDRTHATHPPGPEAGGPLSQSTSSVDGCITVGTATPARRKVFNPVPWAETICAFILHKLANPSAVVAISSNTGVPNIANPSWRVPTPPHSVPPEGVLTRPCGPASVSDPVECSGA